MARKCKDLFSGEEKDGCLVDSPKAIYDRVPLPMKA